MIPRRPGATGSPLSRSPSPAQRANVGTLPRQLASDALERGSVQHPDRASRRASRASTSSIQRSISISPISLISLPIIPFIVSKSGATTASSSKRRTPECRFPLNSVVNTSPRGPMASLSQISTASKIPCSPVEKTVFAYSYRPIPAASSNTPFASFSDGISIPSS